MRSSRRNLCLDPDLVPEVSSESSGIDDNDQPSDNQLLNDEAERERESIASADVDINDSNVSQSDASDEDSSTVVVTSSSSFRKIYF